MIPTALLLLGRIGQTVARAHYEQGMVRVFRAARRMPSKKWTVFEGPARPVFDLVTLHEPGPLLGPFLGNADAERELGAPLAHAPGKLWIVATLDGVPAGCGALFLPEDAAELGSAYVLPAYRGRGIYSDLVDERLAVCSAWPAVTAKCLPRAAGTLARRGFVEVGRKGEYALMRLETAQRARKA